MLTDEQLAQRLKHGDKQALNMLVERHIDALTGYLFRMTNGNRPLAEDLVQETFLAALNSIGRYQPDRPFKPWLYGIATNQARKHFNRADTRHTISDDGTIMDWISDHNGVEDHIARQLDLQQVLAVVDTMPDHQRTVIILRYIEGFALNEISDALSIPVGTVKSRLSLGLRTLRSLVSWAKQ